MQQGDKELDEKAKIASLSHHATLHGVLSLAEILYLPSDGTGDGVVGEEILDWVNTVDRGKFNGIDLDCLFFLISFLDFSRCSFQLPVQKKEKNWLIQLDLGNTLIFGLIFISTSIFLSILSPSK